MVKMRGDENIKILRTTYINKTDMQESRRIYIYTYIYTYIKVKESRNRPGVAQTVPGDLGSQISMIFGT